jgi:acyl-CoA synthetase (AMP-forming)/AMP-acid ligase II
MFHLNAIGGILCTLYGGGSVYALPKFDPVSVLRGIEEHRCTYSAGVPAMYKMLLAEKQELSRDFSSLRLITCGSAPIPPSLVERCGEIFPNARFVEGYGLTECGPVITRRPLAGSHRLGSIGQPLPGFEVKVVDEDGVELPAGKTGELWARNSMCTTLGYLNRPEEDAKRRKPDGWFASGDLAIRDKEGWLYFRGRTDDRMNVGGENVYPAEVEAILARHPKVHDVAVVPVPHETKGEVPVAFVVLEKGGSLTEDELKEHFFAVGPAYAHPRRIVLLPAMPLSPTGKTDRHRLVSMARESQPASV